MRASLRHSLLLGSLLAATGLILLLCAARLTGLAADDSFIHRRIALNYLHLGKAYFNPDQRVMVTSSPLWTMLLAATSAILPASNPALPLEMMFLLLGAAAAYLLVFEWRPDRREEQHEDPSLAVLVLAVMAFLFVVIADFESAAEQMETPCAIALMLWGSLGMIWGKSWGMPLLVLACFSRYECFPFCLMAAAWVTARRQWTRSSLLASAAVALTFLAWLLRQYATVIPNTVIAKSHLYAMSYGEVIRGLGFTFKRAALCLVLAVLWALSLRARHTPRRPAAVLLVAFGVLLGVAYIFSRTYVFPWYPPLLLVPISIGILIWSKDPDSRQLSLGVVFSTAVLFPLLAEDWRFLLAALDGAPRSVSVFPSAARVHEYMRVGSALNDQCPAGTVMSSEIGGLGWGFHGKILDGAGLASPEAIRYHPMRIPEERSKGSWGEIPAGFVRIRHPDLIVTYDIFAESALPAAREMGYVDYVYPLFVREDRPAVHSLWTAHNLHVLVAPDGRCSPPAVDQAVRAAVEK